MGLIGLMRAFTIRFRMVSAIAVVVLLLMLVGAAGTWGIQKLETIQHDLAEHSFGEAVALGKLQTAMAHVQRHELTSIAATDDAQRQQARTAWQGALQQAQGQIAQMLEGEADADNAVLEPLRAALQRYAARVDRGEAGADELAQATQMLDRLEGMLNDEMRAVVADGEDTSQRVLWVFLAMLGLAVLVVVPTTLANMQSICRPLAQAQALADAIAGGNLTNRADLGGADELTALMRSLAGMQDALARTVGEVRQAAENIRLASAEIASGNQDLSQRTEQTSSNLQQTASSMDQITATVRQSSEAAQSAIAMAQRNTEVAQRSGDVVGQVVSTMDDINQSSQKIHDIIGVIDGIAFQTNILALNAAVEAARAGEAGRGFAVVAGEVRSLAQRSAEAAREIKALISASVDKVSAGSQLVHQAGSTIRDVVENAQKVSSFIGDITAATAEQAQGLVGVNSAVSSLDQMTAQNAALVEQSAAAADSLRDQAQRLADLVAVFRLADGLAVAAPSPRRAAPAAAPRPAARPLPNPRPAARAPAIAPPRAPAPQPVARPQRPAATPVDEGDWESF